MSLENSPSLSVMFAPHKKAIVDDFLALVKLGIIIWIVLSKRSGEAITVSQIDSP
jgi:hypothetical protein